MIENLKVINELKNFALENNKEKINWKDDMQTKWTIFYNHFNKNLEINYWRSTQPIPLNICFTSEEIARKAVKTIGVDRIKKYYFDI